MENINFKNYKNILTMKFWETVILIKNNKLIKKIKKTYKIYLIKY